MSKYLEKAMTSLRDIGISFTTQQEEAPVIALLDRISVYDPQLVASIAVTLSQAPAFNAMIRDQIGGMDISTRFVAITDGFNSIREDAELMAGWMADGKLDLSEKLKFQWMKLRRGSIPQRFTQIRGEYLEVAKTTGDQIKREDTILNAYRDYRMASKEAQVAAQQLLTKATAVMAERRTALSSAGEALETLPEGAPEKVQLELTRDVALRALQDEDKSYQIVKDVFDDITTSTNTAELVFARLQQTHTVKERLLQRMITFFATSEVVFSGLAASFTAGQGLGEATNAMDSMTDGMSRGIESLATTGTDQLNKALKSGYGSTIKVESVKALAESVVEFQASSLKLIEELRNESTLSSQAIQEAAEDSKRRFSALLVKGV